MSLLRYDHADKGFSFRKMEIGRVKFHTEKSLLDQVCGRFLVTLKKTLTD